MFQILNKRILSKVFIIVILILSFYLRKHDIYTWPRLGATFDEYAWTWQGMSLIQKGTPMSWSPHPQYSNAKDMSYQKTHFRIVKPYLEHPPVFGLVAGAFAIARGVSDMYQLTLYHIRPLALILGVLSVGLIYLLVLEIYDKKTATLAALLYATVPSIAIGSRIVQNENFFIPIWLLSLWLVVKYIKRKKVIYRNIAAFLCILLVLAKVPWVAAPGSIFLIFAYLKRWRDALIFFGVPFISLFLFGLYGFYYDSKLFLGLWGLQLNRYSISFTSIFAIFQQPYLVDRFMTDGWIYFGWFAYFLLLIKDFKKNYIVILAPLSYFVIFLAGIPNEAGHGWYRYPFYPFLIVSTALFLKEYFAKNWALTFLFLVVVGTALLGQTWEKVFGFSYIVFRLAIIGWGLTFLPQIFPSKKTAKIGSILSYSWFSLFILMNIWTILLYNEQ